ncbi:MAG: hypothetical protein ACPGUV_08340 [Polyangiales bacterium]
MEENDANKANIAELDEHIKRLGGRLDAMAVGTEAYAETRQSLEDYYERLLQIRQMRTDTLEGLLEESTAELEKTSVALTHKSRRLAALAAVLLAVLLCWAEDRAPSAVSGPAAATAGLLAGSPTTLCLCIAVATHVATRWSLRG